MVPTNTIDIIKYFEDKNVRVEKHGDDEYFIAIPKKDNYIAIQNFMNNHIEINVSFKCEDCENVFDGGYIIRLFTDKKLNFSINICDNLCDDVVIKIGNIQSISRNGNNDICIM